MAAGVSGLQGRVLALYRLVHRQSRGLSAQTRESARAYARDEIERYREVSPRRFQLIEHLLRKGHKQLGHLSHPDFTEFVYKPSERR